ncbi:MAG: serine/threonine-protein phosphatase [Lentisphaeria bacterium]|nr:serine/threonine-protein phosphatase [Lentisphaeria bacterium]
MAFALFRNKYFSAGAFTSVGLVRKENQDSYLCLASGGIFAVSDGMGGGEGGARASAIVVQKLAQAALVPLKDPANVERFVHRANREIRDFASANHLRGMGATVVGLVLSPFDPGAGVIFSAGDSRCYRLRKKKLEQLTSDHTVAAAMGIPEEQLAGHLRGVLTNAVGCGNGFFVESHPADLCADDVYLLCSDGVARQVPEAEIRRILGLTDVSASDRARMLVQASLRFGGADNATAVVVTLGPLPEITDDVLAEQAACPDQPDDDEEERDVTPATE